MGSYNTEDQCPRCPRRAPRDPVGCWFTILADGLASFGRGGNDNGPPTELRSEVLEFTKTDGYDDCTATTSATPGDTITTTSPRRTRT